MKEGTVSLTDILNTFIAVKQNKAKKRILFDQAPIGGISRHWVIGFFLLLPLALYAAIFNPSVFGMLGIAQAIIFFIVFLSMTMILIVALVFINNNKVIRSVMPSWNKLFPSVDFKQLIRSGMTPYSEFYHYHAKALADGLDEEALYKRMQENFKEMQLENHALYLAMNENLQQGEPLHA